MPSGGMLVFLAPFPRISLPQLRTISLGRREGAGRSIPRERAALGECWKLLELSGEISRFSAGKQVGCREMFRRSIRAEAFSWVSEVPDGQSLGKRPKAPLVEDEGLRKARRNGSTNPSRKGLLSPYSRGGATLHLAENRSDFGGPTVGEMVVD